jgi:hypothetical protein
MMNQKFVGKNVIVWLCSDVRFISSFDETENAESCNKKGKKQTVFLTDILI